MEKNGNYEIEIFDVSTAGEGIGRVDGIVTFVPGLIPGDKATIEITDIKKNIARGRIVTIDVASGDRVEPHCEYFKRCGGCTLQHMSYEAELRLKEKQLCDKLDRIYGGEYTAPEPIIGIDDPWAYRNKAVYSIYAGSAKLQKDGSVKNSERPRVGFFDGKGRNIVECRECPIQSAPANAAAEALREYIRQTGVTVYDEKTRKGKLRQLMVRSGFNSREVMVMLTMNGKKLPNPELLADLMFDAIDALNDDVARRLDEAAAAEGFGGIYTTSEEAACAGTMSGNLGCFPGYHGICLADVEALGCGEDLIEIDYGIIDKLQYKEAWYELKSLVINHNQNQKLTDISTDIDVIYGSRVIKDWITVKGPAADTGKTGNAAADSTGKTGNETDSDTGKYVNGNLEKHYVERTLEFEISPFSFYQVNPVQMEKLYSTVLEFADLKKDETILDLYCGVGTIGLCCAPDVKKVWGIEAIKSAVIDANRNAVINGLVNIQFMQGKAEEEIDKLLDAVRAENHDGSEIGLVIVDPPRAGCKPELLETILKVAPERIVYVSCDPGTLARDLKLLVGGADAGTAGGATYRIERIRQVDQFSHSTHVETVCLLSNRKADSHIKLSLDMDEYYDIIEKEQAENK